MMDYEYDAERSDAFLSAARERKLVDDDQAETIRRESAERSLTPAQVAIESGIMKPVEAEIAEAFAAPRDLAPGYELLDVLGYGALGVVYRARQPLLKRDVAIKAIMQSRLVEQNVLARFQQEGAAIGRLHHPNIVGAFDSGSHRHRLFLVMELVRGVDLRHRIEKDGRLEWAAALSVVRQTAAGLSHALSHGIIHRDIKPGNLILTDAPAGFELPEGIPLVKIADFGLARLSPPADAEDATQLTIAGSALGTPMYCAPEQLSGDPVDHRADIYALGATLVNMLSGSAPFKETKISKLITAKLTGKKYDDENMPADLPKDVVALIDGMIAHDPEQRIESYEELIRRIDQILAPGVSMQASVTPTSATPAPASTNRVRIPIVVVVVLLLCASAWGAYKSLPGLFADPVPTMEMTAWHIPLFDGKNVTPWKTNGLWTSKTVEGLGNVLIGSGGAWRRVPQPQNPNEGMPDGIAIEVGLAIHTAKSAEVHFGFADDDIERSERLVVQLANDQVRLGKRSGADGDLETLHVVDAQSDSDSEPDYHVISVQRHGEYWFAFFDDAKPFGFARADPNGANDVIQLVANQGEVYFSDLSASGMRPQIDES